MNNFLVLIKFKVAIKNKREGRERERTLFRELNQCILLQISTVKCSRLNMNKCMCVSAKQEMMN